MSLPPSLPDGAGVIRLPASCSTASAASLHAELAAKVAAATSCRIDGSAVETVGQAMLQLLLAAKSACPDLRIGPASPVFAERIRACALGDTLTFTEEA